MFPKLLLNFVITSLPNSSHQEHLPRADSEGQKKGSFLTTYGPGDKGYDLLFFTLTFDVHSTSKESERQISTNNNLDSIMIEACSS